MKFYQYFPQISYDFNGTRWDITNLTAHVKITERLKQHVSVLYDYIIEDGDRPDTVALKLYGSVDYTWVVLVVNNILSLYDWPLTSEEFDRYIIDKYGSLLDAQSGFYYTTADGDLVDETTFNALPAASRGSLLSFYDDELVKNEAKRRIKAVPQAFAEAMTVELRQAMRT